MTRLAWAGVLLAAAACSGPTPEPASPIEVSQQPTRVIDVDLTASAPAPPPSAQAATDAADAGADAATEVAEDAQEPETVGMIGVIGSDTALGSLTGQDVGDTDHVSDTMLGAGGLGLSGIGPSVGATGVGLGAIGGGAGPGGGRGGAGFGSGPRANASLGTPQAQGKLPPDVIRRVVRTHMARIRYCYERRLLQNPKLEGKFVVQFVIGKDGGVVNAQPKSATMPDPQVIACVVSAFRDMAFPAPEGGGVVVVSYPILFSPDAPAPPPAPAPSATKPPAPPAKP